MAELTAYIDGQDIAAVLYFLSCWIGYSAYAIHNRGDHSLLSVTNRYRLQWVREMLKRENRSPDAMMVGNLQRIISFFANTTIFILLGLVSLLGYHDRISAIFDMIPFAKKSYPLIWEMKIFLLVIIFIYAFFKYTWSLRQYNYAGIFMMAAPAPGEQKENHELIAQRGGFLISNAADHFNSGLRAYYFGLAALGWFLHPFLFIAATTLVVYVTYRREYRSHTLKNLLHG